MKVAVCFSGLVGPDASENVNRFRKSVPYDCFFGHWSGREALGGVDSIELVEPELHYNPANGFVGDVPFGYKYFIRNGLADRPEWEHRTKQIMAHAMMCDLLPEQYDVVIRARYDTIVDPNIDIDYWARLAFGQRRAIGFYVPKGQNSKYLQNAYVNEPDHPRALEHLPDHMIIHPRCLMNSELVFSLHELRQLIVAEWGWYQVLSLPFGKNHLSILGKAGVTKEK